MRTLGNTVLIFLIFFGVYTYRDKLQPIAEQLGIYVHEIVLALENKSGTPASEIPQETSIPKQSIVTPGPLEVPASKTPTAATKPVSTAPSSTQAPKGFTTAAIIYWTNQARKDNGNLPALTENKTLDSTALAKAQDLFAKQYFEHTSPTGVTVSTQVQAAGYEYIMIGENLALGNFDSPEAIVTAWMNSPGHRANILNNRYSEMGAAVISGMYQGREVWMAVQHFGLPQNACPEVDVALKAQIDINQSQIDALKAQIDAEKKQLDQYSNQYSFEYNSLVDKYNSDVNKYNSLISTTKSEISQYNGEVKAYNACVQG